MKQGPKIVVTGFEAFAHGTENPTLDVLAQLRAANDIEGDLTTVQIPSTRANSRGSPAPSSMNSSPTFGSASASRPVYPSSRSSALPPT